MDRTKTIRVEESTWQKLGRAEQAFEAQKNAFTKRCAAILLHDADVKDNSQATSVASIMIKVLERLDRDKKIYIEKQNVAGLYELEHFGFVKGVNCLYELTESGRRLFHDLDSVKRERLLRKQKKAS